MNSIQLNIKFHSFNYNAHPFHNNYHFTEMKKTKKADLMSEP